MEANSYKKQDKFLNALQEHTYTCKCGHRVVITHKSKYVICDYCGRSVFRNPKEEFVYRLGVKLNGRKNI